MDEHIPVWIKDNLPTDLYASQLFRITVTLPVEDKNEKPKKLTIDVLPALEIEYDMLEKALEDMPATFAYFSSVYSEARKQVTLYERAIKARKGLIMKTIAAEQREAKTRLTSDQITRIIDADEDIDKLEMKLAERQMQSGKLYYFLEALRMKNDNLRTLAGFKKQEQSHQ